MITLSTRQKKVVKAVGYPLFFVCFFLIFLSFTFPSHRFRSAAERQLASILGRDVKIGELSISPLGSVLLEQVELGGPPLKSEKKENIENDTEQEEEKADGEDEKPPPTMVYQIEKIDLNVGLFALLSKRLNIEVDMDFLGGSLVLEYEGAFPKGNEGEAGVDVQKLNRRYANERRRPSAAGKEPEDGPAGDRESDTEDVEDEEQEMSFYLKAKELNLVQFVDLADFLPLPLFGKVGFEVDIATDSGKFNDAKGKVSVWGSGISLGSGKSKVEVIEGMGPMTVDSISIDSMKMAMKCEKGICQVEQSDVRSNELDLAVDGDIRFVTPFERSRFNLYFTFKLLEGYAEKSSTARTLVSLMPTALSRARRQDGYYGYNYFGRIKNLKFKPRKRFVSKNRRTTARRIDPGGQRGSQTVRGARQDARARMKEAREESRRRMDPGRSPSSPPEEELDEKRMEEVEQEEMEKEAVEVDVDESGINDRGVQEDEPGEEESEDRVNSETQDSDGKDAEDENDSEQGEEGEDDGDSDGDDSEQ